MPHSNTFGLDGRVAVITGGGSGIGRAMAQCFAEAGADLVLLDLNSEGLNETVSSIGDHGRRILAHVGDVSNEADVKLAVQAAVDELGRLDIVANIAGFAIDCPIAEMTDDIFDRLYSVHLKGTLYGTKHALRAMPAFGGGSVINCASVAMDGGRPGLGGYVAMKSAIAGLTRIAAWEGGKDGIRCNTLAPGVVTTALTLRHGLDEEGVFDQTRLDAWLAAIKSRLALDFVGTAMDIAYLALFLASDAGRNVTGQIIRSNGGMHMAP